MRQGMLIKVLRNVVASQRVIDWIFVELGTVLLFISLFVEKRKSSAHSFRKYLQKVYLSIFCSFDLAYFLTPALDGTLFLDIFKRTQSYTGPLFFFYTCV